MRQYSIRTSLDFITASWRPIRRLSVKVQEFFRKGDLRDARLVESPLLNPSPSLCPASVL